MSGSAIPREAALLCALGFAVILIYVSPWLIHGEDSYVRIHDGLDSNIVWHTLTAREKIWFAPNGALVAPVFVGGAPRISFPSELKAITALFAALEPFRAYVAHQVVIRLVAFLGMAFLLLEILPEPTRNRVWIAAGAGTAYAIVPFWAWTGAAAAVACVVLACWRLQAGKGIGVPLVLLAAYPFVSSLVLGGMFVVGFVWLFFAWSVWTRHRVGAVLAAALVLTAAQIVAEYRLFLFLLNPDFTPHRVEFVIGHTDLPQAITAFLNEFLYGASGLKSIQSPIVLVSAAVTLMLAAIAGGCRRMTARMPSVRRYVLTVCEIRLIVLLIVTLAACAAFSFGFAFWEWSGSQIIRNHVPLLNRVNVSRINYLSPFAWSLVFALCMTLLTSRLPRILGLTVIGTLAGLQVLVAAQHHEFVVERNHSGITYSRFFAEPMFDRIATDLRIDRKKAVVASIGMHPSIAQYNGFKTADAYLPLYPITYKHQFRHMMIHEFNRNQDVLSYFDGWGSRVYMFLSEIRCPRSDTNCTSEQEHVATSLQVSLQTLKNFGIDYLFSVARIGNAEDIGLVDRGTFRDPASAWAVTVYQVGASGP